ncbi:MAG: hypothetical protein IPL32_15805 [Chloracidobacterium sp.]|nr:hypothetical protein [Chloracidobacterium sp.]
MPSIETIYQQTVLPLPPDDRIRLAEIIMEHAREDVPGTNGHRSALELLESLPSEAVFKDTDSVDKHLQSERDSWDN